MAEPMDNGDDAEVENAAEKEILEEHKIWKKNTPFLYDLVITHCLDWPSLTVEFFPDKEEIPGKDYSVQRMLLGTHTSDAAPNYLMVAKCRLPLDSTEVDGRHYDSARGEMGGFGVIDEKIEIFMKITHEGEVNRARFSPQNPNLVATKGGGGGDAFLFDVTKHSSKPTEFMPDLRLTGHTQEGYGLAWSPFKSNYVLSGSDDGVICIWDVESSTQRAKMLAPQLKLTKHEKNVEDVAWHRHHSELFGSVGDDHRLMFWDMRDAANGQPKLNVKAHSAEVNCLAFSSYNEHIIVTGSDDKTLRAWDIRQLAKSNAEPRPLHTFEGHQGEVLRVDFAPFADNVFASAGADRRLHVWDVDRVGNEQTPDDAEDGPPELLFIHGGHTSRLSDFSWSPVEDWMIASVSEDNVVQVWLPAHNIYAADEDDGAEIPPQKLE